MRSVRRAHARLKLNASLCFGMFSRWLGRSSVTHGWLGTARSRWSLCRFLAVCSVRSPGCCWFIPTWCTWREAFPMRRVLALRPRMCMLLEGGTFVVTSLGLLSGRRRWLVGRIPSWGRSVSHPLPCFIGASPSFGSLLS